MNKRKFTQQEAEEMFILLKQIHSALKDKYQNKSLQISFYELAWMVGIEKYITQKKSK